jgi:Type III secretion protein (HpaP)
MRPVARVRSSTGARSPAGLGDARAAALRGRFEQLLQGSGEGLPSVSQTLWSHGAPPPPPSVDRGAALDAPIAQTQAMPGALPAAAMPPGDAPDRAPSPSGTARSAERATGSDAAAPAATAPLRVVEPPAPAASASSLGPCSPAPPLLAQTPAAAAAWPDTTALTHAAQSSASRVSDKAEPAAVLPPLPAATTSRAEMQAQPQPPATQPKPARGARDGLPELVRDLVQAVVHMSRGREGHWRLTMALKPQVLEGTLVALQAEPGRLQVRFDCAGADAGARLVAVRDDLRLRLTETLSAARPVDVRVDVHLQTQERAHGVGVV